MSEKNPITEPNKEPELVEIYYYTGVSLMDELKSHPKFNYDEIVQDLQDQGLLEEITTILNTYTNTPLLENLCGFCMKYGILEILRFIYEHINFLFEIHNLGQFTHFNYLELNDLGFNDSIFNKWVRNKQYKDARSKNRLRCLNYFTHMKRYSRCLPFEKKFYYLYNKDKYGIMNMAF